jgi:drug/metabolite transporter (DMT)-like permease
VLWWRYALGAVVMLAVLGLGRLPPLPRSDALAWLVLGGGGQALLVGLALSSLRFIDVATLAFLFYTYPAWVTVVQTVRGAERPSVARLTALILSFGGVVLISGRPGAGAVAWQGVALALSAALVYGGYIPLMQRMQKTHSVLVTSTYAKIGSAVCFLVLAGGPAALTFALSRTAWLAILALTIFSTVLPGVFFLMGLMRLGPVRTAIVSTVEPFLTAALGLVVLHQPVTLALLLGGAMIVAAVITLQLPRERVA